MISKIVFATVVLIVQRQTTGVKSETFLYNNENAYMYAAGTCRLSCSTIYQQTNTGAQVAAQLPQCNACLQRCESQNTQTILQSGNPYAAQCTNFMNNNQRPHQSCYTADACIKSCQYSTRTIGMNNDCYATCCASMLLCNGFNNYVCQQINGYQGCQQAQNGCFSYCTGQGSCMLAYIPQYGPQQPHNG